MQSNHKTVVFSVLYPGLSDSIVTDFIESIVNQTDSEFNWLMINDNCANDQLRLFPKSTIWINLTTPLSFGKIRQMGISFATANGYQNIIFSDIDDYYSENRIELSKQYLQDFDFVFTELQIVSLEKDPICSDFITKLPVNRLPTGIDAILDQNYIGLSHSAVRASALRNIEMPEALEVADWWIFSLLLLQGRRGRFMPEADTYYRQSSENYVGVLKLLDIKRLRRGIDVKLNHYGSLLEYCNRKHLFDTAAMLTKKHSEMIVLKEKMIDDEFSEIYIETVNSHFNQLYKGWWSEIVSLETWGKL